MTKVRGNKGFDALFSRVFDEPGLKNAVGNLHDDFSAPKGKRSSHVPEESSVTRVLPAVAPASVEEPPEVETPIAPTKIRQTVAVNPPAVAEIATEPPVAAPPVIADIEPVDDDELSVDSFFARKVTPAPPAPPAPPVRTVQTVTAPEPVVAPVAIRPVVAAPVPVVTPVAIKPVVTPPAPVAAVPEPVVAPVAIKPVIPAPAPVVAEPAPVAVREPVAAPVAIKPAVAAPVVTDDDDDLLLEDFFSRKDKRLPITPAATAVAPVAVERSAPQGSVSSAVAEKPAAPANVVEPEVTAPAAPELQSAAQPAAQTPGPFTEDQARILMFLYKVGAGLTNVDIIVRELGIEIPIVREALLLLVTEGYLYLLDKKRMDGYTSSGFTYKMNSHLCAHYAAELRGDVAVADVPPPGISRNQPGGRTLVYNKSMMEVKKAVTPPSPPVVLDGAVGAYWEGEGLEEAKAQKWCSIFGVEIEQMTQQLEWARFDLETNKRRENIKKDLVSWFYDRLMITGGMYPRPHNYQSAAELRAEAMLQQLEHDLSAKAKFAEMEFVNALQSFLAYPEAPLYQELLGRVNSFALEQLQAGEGKAAAIDLEALFKVRWGMTDNDPTTSTVSFALSGVGKDKVVASTAPCGAVKTIPLAAGWNLVGYPGEFSQPVSHATSSISTHIVSIWGWSRGQWHSYAPARQANSLTTFEPGMGYWVNMKQPAVWTLP